ncbi:MAG TPA: hypothetical protein VGB79_04565 [Allosphingosinicella sp.]|jgi:hypothetical protein
MARLAAEPEGYCVPRRRRNDPLGVSDNPNVVTDPERLAELVEEFTRRLDYLMTSYRTCAAAVPDSAAFNRSLKRLQRAVRLGSAGSAAEERLDPRLEILISQRAREMAGLGCGDLLGEEHAMFVERAAADVASSTAPIRGRPVNLCLRHHVFGLMALIQDTCGMPVVSSREKNSVYDPQLPDASGRTMAFVFSELDPTVTKTQLVNIIREARRAYAGKPMRFRNFFPLYGAHLDAGSMVPTPGPGYRLERFEIAAPIYCR